MDHRRSIYADGKVIGEMISPYTNSVGVGNGDDADVQRLARGFQRVFDATIAESMSYSRSFIPRRVVVLDEWHSLYFPRTDEEENTYNISVLFLRENIMTEDVVENLIKDLNAGIAVK